MRWERGRRSDNIEDQRSGGGLASGGIKAGGIGAVIIVVVGLASGQDPMQILNSLVQYSNEQQAGSSYSSDNTNRSVEANHDVAGEFVAHIHGSNEDVWRKILPEQARINYQVSKLVYFERNVRSACGQASSAMGPFYCPADQKAYIDLGFFNELAAMGGKGDFAQAYVIAHEVGHHIQNLLGTSMKVYRMQQRSSEAVSNRLSVLMELQADCYAGIWAHHSQRQLDWLEAGDIEEGLQAAASIGDDSLQRNAGQQVNPEGFTHGTSKQRSYWLTVGIKYGDMQRCDTFAAAN
ncbi:MAG: KPN_02809 family neutral zinc metallopeptidase [bacterium]